MSQGDSLVVLNLVRFFREVHVSDKCIRRHEFRLYYFNYISFIIDAGTIV